MSKLALDSLTLIIGKIISGIANIAGGVILARGLTVSEYGTYSQLVLIASTLLIFSNLSLPRGLYYFLPRAQNDSEKKAISFQITTATFIFSSMFAAAIIPLTPYLSIWFNNKQILSSSLYISIYLFALSISSLSEPFLIAIKRAQLASLIELSSGILCLISIIIPICLDMDFRRILLFMSFGLFSKNVIQLIILFNMKGHLTIRSLFSNLRDKITYSLPLSIDSMIGVIARRIDQIIIASMFLPAQYALYARGAFELPLVATIPMTISNLLLPDFSKYLMDGQTGKVLWHLRDKARRIAILFFPLTGFMLLLAEAFIILLFSDKYSRSVSIFRIYLLLLPLRITSLGAVIKASGKTKLFIVSNTIALASNVVLSVSLIKLIGMAGAAWGTVLSVMIVLFYIMWLTCKILSTSISKILPWRDLASIASVSIIAVLISSPVLLFKGYVCQIILGCVIYFVAYGISGFYFNIFKEDDISLLRNLIAKVFR